MAKPFMSSKATPGFTIVELLIVIVVIGILASITIVSYTGIVKSAYATKASSVADAYVKLLKMYKVEHGSYPETSEDGVCLGSAGNYPAEGIFEAGQCAIVDFGDGSPLLVASVSESVNTLLMDHVNMLPNTSLPPVRLSDGSGMDGHYRGLVYQSDINFTALTYALSGDQDCPRGERFYIEEMNFSGCTIILD